MGFKCNDKVDMNYYGHFGSLKTGGLIDTAGIGIEKMVFFN